MAEIHQLIGRRTIFGAIAFLAATFAIAYAPAAAQENNTSDDATKKVVFIAGRQSHGWGAHEHYAGSLFLAKRLESAMPNFKTEVHQNGWPDDPSTLEDADAIVIYCDGGGGHLVNRRLEVVDALMKKGIGLGCIHYAVEVPKGEPGDRFVDWVGGYFETDWSVNPHWVAEFKEFPDHPVARGVEPFSINDEWYYHMRFREDMQGVTPILTAVPPASTLERPDGPHSGNPHVRAKAGQPQHVAWVAERPDGGRGFGFTGGHYHANWADDNFRRTVLNGIVWIAGGEVPEGGVQDETPTQEELDANQDEPKPDQQRRERRGRRGGREDQSSRAFRGAKFASPVVSAQTPGHAVDVEADIRGAKRLYLVVTDGGDGFSCDWADWAQPRLIGPDGERRLTELKWQSARSDWGEVRVGRNAGGGRLEIDGRTVEYGIGTHAGSVIAYDLPEGYTQFKARAGLDNGGTDQGGGSTVRFVVFTDRLPGSIAERRQRQGQAEGDREPAEAVTNLNVAEGLAATLFAAEPMIVSLTNLDVDHRGRVWVCEVVNYRGNNGRRPEGDRILILEDTDGDGQADTSKVFYQGRDIDSAMGICVLGNRVIVSASPHIFVFTDEDGDDKPDKKELLFTNTGQPQHDHSAHSFLFGPDGKLYWNFGNSGRAVHDAQGNPVVDATGNRVVDNGRPYYGGMVFRCNLDGSGFETLAHNFRNNYEVTVDSFGTLWQSDNDDDGNRGVRINYVMEGGNFGYLDERTGAGWQTPRTGMHEEVPLRHWHLNDPGVVPNVLQTGAGSPCGITVYEGRLLPEVFWDEMIHADAGPSVVRAYPVTEDGAGYSATIENILEGSRDNWFRPADVAVAPDGSLFVTDWYDPGVGGHAQRDLDRGRLFRVAPPGHKYRAPEFDFNTPQGAAQALTNPAYSVRYLAWTALQSMGEQAQPALAELYDSDNPRHRARALWLLARLPESGEKWRQRAIADDNSDIRITALRAVCELGGDVHAAIENLASDPAPQVRRECALALASDDSDRADRLWAELAARHDGQDRWYLEALGIGARGHWNSRLAAYLSKADDPTTTAAGRDIVWRSRSDRTPGLLAAIIVDPNTPDSDLPRYFRAFDFLEGEAKREALLRLAFDTRVDSRSRADMIAREAVTRLDSGDVAPKTPQAAALAALLDRQRGTLLFVELVERFKLTDRNGELLAMAIASPDSQLGVEAMSALLSLERTDLIHASLMSRDPVQATAVTTALAATRDGRAAELLLAAMNDTSRDLELRRQAARGLSKLQNGAQRLIRMARDQKLDEQLQSAVAFSLHSAPWNDIRQEAEQLFPLPAVKGDDPLPSVERLVRMRGDVAQGKRVFDTTGTCANCHQVSGQGKQVGPDLTEIGSKLSREALFESILYPSAGISHSYETYVLALTTGNIVSGILVSETPQAVTIRTDDAITRTFARGEIEQMRQQPVSLMPADLQKTMSADDLADVVAYMETLRAAGQ